MQCPSRFASLEDSKPIRMMSPPLPFLLVLPWYHTPKKNQNTHRTTPTKDQHTPPYKTTRLYTCSLGYSHALTPSITHVSTLFYSTIFISSKTLFPTLSHSEPLRLSQFNTQLSNTFITPYTYATESQHTRISRHVLHRYTGRGIPSAHATVG